VDWSVSRAETAVSAQECKQDQLVRKVPNGLASAKKNSGVVLRMVVMMGIAGVGTMAFAQEGRKVLVHPQQLYPDLAK
jgi:hypothetical protein